MTLDDFWPQGLHLQNSATSLLGAIKMAGYIKNSRGEGQGNGRRLGRYALIYSLKGTGYYWDEINGKRTLLPGDAFFVFPEVEHRYGALDGCEWDECFLIFEGPLFDLWRTQGIICADRPFLHLEPILHWGTRIRDCLITRGRIGQAATLCQVNALQQLVMDAILGQDETQSGTKLLTWLDQACETLSSPSSRDLSLPELAESLGIAFETFRKQFKDAMGLAPGAWRTAKLIEQASYLLAKGIMNSKEISKDLGFSDEYHFSKQFKAKMGMTPKAFRSYLAGL